MSMIHRAFRLALALAAWIAFAPTLQATPADLIVIFDASGSMWGQIGGKSKIEIGREALGRVIDGLPADQQVALVAYGHRRESDCADIETLKALGALERSALKASVAALKPKGKTPITAAFEHALHLRQDRPTTMVLVSDGLETCQADPCAAVRKAKAAGSRDFVLHVIGFDVGKEDVSSLECAAQAGGGLYLGAADAAQLGAALEQAVAQPADRPAGTLWVTAKADGKLQDVAIQVRKAGAKDDLGAFRTYAKAETNPRAIPLPDGDFEVTVSAIGLKGDIERRFPVRIAAGAKIEKTLDFSTGELTVEVRRDGALSDATYRVYLAGSRQEAASGRTYTQSGQNPARLRLTAGSYDVEVASVEIAGQPTVSLGKVDLVAGGQRALSHDFASGTLAIGVRRGAQLIDATVVVKSGGAAVGQARTYVNARTNPKVFVLPPGEYLVEVKEVRGGAQLQRKVTVAKGAKVEETFELP